jgi:hypothetical protein
MITKKTEIELEKSPPHSGPRCRMLDETRHLQMHTILAFGNAAPDFALASMSAGCHRLVISM